MKKLLLFIMLIISVNVLADADGRRDFAIFYEDKNQNNAAEDSVIHSTYARRMGITTHSETSNAGVDSLKRYNPDLLTFFYIDFISLTPSGYAYNKRDSIATANSWDVESLFLHVNDTTVNSGGDTSFPFVDGAVASRILTAYRGVRYQRCWTEPDARNIEIAYIKWLLSNNGWTDQWGDSSANYFDGIYWDNSDAIWYKKPGGESNTLVRGGHIYEHQTNALFSESNKQSGSVPGWWYDSNMVVFYHQLLDTLANYTNWRTNGKPVYSMPNTSAEWDLWWGEDGVATHLFLEFRPNLFKPETPARWEDWYPLDSTCFANDVCMMYDGAVITSFGGSDTTITKAEAMHRTLCFFYTCRTDSAYIFHHYGTVPGPDTVRFWPASMSQNMGDPTGLFSVAQSGTDPDGNSYEIKRRDYDSGFVLLRVYEGSGASGTTGVSYNLGGTYKELYPDGTLSGEITSVTILNADGKILLNLAGSSTDTSSFFEGDINISGDVTIQ